MTDAWRRGQALSVHGCVYGLHDGLLRDLGLTVQGEAMLREGYAQAIESIAQRYADGT